jgi:hypothetical protein
MTKLPLTCLLTALLLLAPIGVFAFQPVWNADSERRSIAPFPKLPEKMRAREIKGFFSAFDAFFADHFPLRPQLLSLSQSLHELGGDDLDSAKCYRGKGNWLFLGNDYAHCVDKLQGTLPVPEAMLQHWTARYVKLRDTARQRGTAFAIFIGPNKSSIYPEYLPPMIFPAKERFNAPLEKALRELGVAVYDPADRLIQAKSQGILYYRTDTHWNSRGAYEAFAGFAEYAGLPPLPPLSFGKAGVHHGDLLAIGGYKRFPLSPDDNCTVDWAVPPVWSEKDGRALNPRAASDKTAWVFGDSFAGALKAYCMAMFKEVRFFTHQEFEAVMAAESAMPDMVVWVMVERSLMAFSY